MFGPVLRRSSLLLAFLTLASGCAVEGTTPTGCPEMPVNSDPNADEVLKWREDAAKAGCLTPLGEPFAPASGGSP